MFYYLVSTTNLSRELACFKLSKDGTTIQYKTESKETQNGATIENELMNNNIPPLEGEL